jgi:hypothetical protein
MHGSDRTEHHHRTAPEQLPVEGGDPRGPEGRRFKDVAVDEWKPGGIVRVSSLSAEMRDLLENELARQREAGMNENLRAFYVWLCAVNPAGERLFDNVEQVAVLGRKSARPIERIFTETLKLNDLSEQAVESEAKNSAGEGSDTSSSPSP